MKLGKAIRSARKARGLTLEELALMAGTDTGNLSRLERGLQWVSEDLLMRILGALNLPLLDVGTVVRLNHGQMPLVPVLCWANLPSQIASMDDVDLTGAARSVACPVQHGPHTFALTVRGESMTNQHGDKSFRDGDIIFVDPAKEPAHRSFVVAQLPGAQDATFRQLIIEGADRFLKPLNAAWPGGIVPLPADAVICGTVIFRGEAI